MNTLYISSEAAMQISLEKESSVVTSESEFFGGVRSPWDNSSDSSIPKSSLVNLNMGASAHDSHNTKLLCFQFRDQDSSSTTQSTGQSDSEVVSIKGTTSLYGQTSGHDECSGKSVIGGHQAKQIPSMGAQEFMFASQLDCGQPIAHIPFQYAEPYFGGLLAAATYGPQAMNYHSQFVGVSPARVPLPLGHLTEDEPIYVNAKQYGAILRRRQSRAKLEAQNKLVKARKPYLHESRHLHALKRARGSGGRFLTAKEIRGSKDGSGQSENNNKNKKEGSSTTSCSEVTSGGGGDVFRQRDFGFSGYAAGHMHHQNHHHHVSARQ